MARDRKELTLKDIHEAQMMLVPTIRKMLADGADPMEIAVQHSCYLPDDDDIAISGAEWPSGLRNPH